MSDPGKSSSGRALCIPAAVLVLDLTWSARLVLAEVLDLYRVNGNVWALDSHFADRCRMKKRTVGAAIKELEEVGLIQRETNQSARHKRILTPLIDAEGNPRPIAKSATGLLQNLQQPIAKSATDLSQNLQGPIADSADINTNYSFKGNFNELTHLKTGASASDFPSSSQSQKVVTAPNPVAAPPSPPAEAAPAPVADNPDDARALVPEMAALWKVSEKKSFQSWAKLTRFALAIASQGRLADLREQFAGYKAFFQTAGLTPHNLDKFTGHEGQRPPYSLGTWCECDWVAKAKDRKPRPSSGTPETPTRASFSMKKKTDWS